MPTPTQEQKRRYADDGIFLAKHLLTPAQIRTARSCYDHARANPSPYALTAFGGTEHEHFVDNTHPECWELGLRDLVADAGFAD